MHTFTIFFFAVLTAVAYGCDEGAYYPHESDCNQYYQCVHGRKQANRCGSGLHWNTKATTCDWPANAGCTSTSDGTTQSSSSSSSSSRTTGSTSTETTTQRNNGGPVGICSWYGAEGEIPPGHPTACGNGFNRFAMAAAEPHIPNPFKCGTRVRVTNLENGQTVDVTVDDKGPNPPAPSNRIMDLTYGAFGVIADRDKGLINCTFVVL